jgi:hypothetical protein
LYYNWHRYYEPELGRYITADPIGLGGGDVNLYRYVGNRPLGRVDRTGRMADSDPTIFRETDGMCEKSESPDSEITLVDAPCDRSWGWCYTRCIETLAPGFDEFFIGSQILSNAPWEITWGFTNTGKIFFFEEPHVLEVVAPKTIRVMTRISRVVRPIQAVAFSWVTGASYGCMLSCALDPCSY